MPGLGGEEVCRRLRADPRTCHVPLIVISALPAAAARARLADCPHDGYLAKPFDLNDLLAVVDRALGTAN
jgi:two-component system cell cycle response regulator